MKRRLTSRPDAIRNRRQNMKNVKNALQEETLQAGAKGAIAMAKNSHESLVTVQKMPKYLKVTEERLQAQGIIDLKPAFARSTKKKHKEGGGWYLTIPIARKTSSMSRRNYEELRGVQVAPDSRKTVVSKYLYDKRRESSVESMNYKPKSNQIEKRKTGNRKHAYTSFRTVSDRSPANSWIINRGKIQDDNTSKTFRKHIDYLMKYKMKHGWE